MVNLDNLCHLGGGVEKHHPGCKIGWALAPPKPGEAALTNGPPDLRFVAFLRE